MVPSYFWKSSILNFGGSFKFKRTQIRKVSVLIAVAPLIQHIYFSKECNFSFVPFFASLLVSPSTNLASVGVCKRFTQGEEQVVQGQFDHLVGQAIWLGLGQTMVHEWLHQLSELVHFVFQRFHSFTRSIHRIWIIHPCLGSADCSTTNRRIRYLRSYGSTYIRKIHSQTNK